MSEHTPTPWTIKQSSSPVRGEFDFAILANIKGEIRPQIIAEAFGRTSETYAPNAQANAELIVRAVNAHDDLVEALSDLRARYYEALVEFGGWTETRADIACHSIDTVLAKASGK